MKKKKVFSSQEENEKIIKVLNKHYFILAKNEVLPTIIFFIAMIIMIICIFLKTEYSGYIFLVAFVFFLFSLVWAYYGYFVWSRDKYIITDQRIVDVEQNTFFSRSQKEAPLEKIQNVAFEIKGFWGSAINFGSVVIQTAGEPSLTLDDVSEPVKVQKTISDLIRNNKEPEDKNGGLVRKMIDMLKNMSTNNNEGEKNGPEIANNDSLK